MSFKNWFKEPPPKPVRHGLRHPAPQFTMVHPSGASPSVKEDLIKDISPTGVFLLTQERWDAGTEVPLTLHRRAGKDEVGFADLTMLAKVVRCAGDGVALSFDLPRDIHPDVWVALVERVSQFAPIHYKIFATACDRATKVWADGKLTSRPLIYTTDEVLNLGASKDLGRMERELQHLFSLGFFISDNVPSSYLPKDELNLAPTPLGLELYTRFHAHRGSPEEYYGLGSRTSARSMAMPSLARM